MRLVGVLAQHVGDSERQCSATARKLPESVVVSLRGAGRLSCRHGKGNANVETMRERYESRERMMRDVGRLMATGWVLSRIEKLPGGAVRIECHRCSDDQLGGMARSGRDQAVIPAIPGALPAIGAHGPVASPARPHADLAGQGGE